MNSLLFKDVDPTNLLNKEFGDPIDFTNEDGKKCLKWKTPYGVSFVDSGMKKMDLFSFYYDDDLFMKGKVDFGVCSGADVEQALKMLKKNPNLLKVMPKGMQILKDKGLNVTRHMLHLGQWHAHNEKCSVINNPLGVSLGYTFSEDEYELMIFSNEKVYERLTLEGVLQKIKHLL